MFATDPRLPSLFPSLTIWLALLGGEAQAICVNKVTNQPAACPGAPPPAPVAAGIGATMVLVGPPIPIPQVRRMCRDFWSGVARPCRALPLPMLPLPPSLPDPAGPAPLPPPGYGPPH